MPRVYAPPRMECTTVIRAGRSAPSTLTPASGGRLVSLFAGRGGRIAQTPQNAEKPGCIGCDNCPLAGQHLDMIVRRSSESDEASVGTEQVPQY
jgi:hypothetical protein